MSIENLCMIIDENEKPSLKSNFFKFGLKEYIQKYLKTEDTDLYNALFKLEEEYFLEGENKMIFN
jgi:hypothetical protein